MQAVPRGQIEKLTMNTLTDEELTFVILQVHGYIMRNGICDPADNLSVAPRALKKLLEAQAELRRNQS